MRIFLALFLLFALRAFPGVSPLRADVAEQPSPSRVRPKFSSPANSLTEVDMSQYRTLPESSETRLENEPPLSALYAEEVRLRLKWDAEKQSEEDKARGIVRATPGGVAMKVCWSLNEAKLEV